MEEKICRSCGFSGALEFRFCRGCGIEFAEDDLDAGQILVLPEVQAGSWAVFKGLAGSGIAVIIFCLSSLPLWFLRSDGEAMGTPGKGLLRQHPRAAGTNRDVQHGSFDHDGYAWQKWLR